MESYVPAPGDVRLVTLSSSTVQLETTGDDVTVTVIGEVDMADADRVGDLLEAAARGGKPKVRVDLSGLTFADSSAIKALLIGSKTADECGATFQIVNPHGAVRRLLDVTGLSEALNVLEESAGRERPGA